MRITIEGSSTQVWVSLLNCIQCEGVEQFPRGKRTRELLGVTTEVDMRFPVVLSPARKLSYDFMVAEARWILNGDDRVEPIAKYAPSIRQFSDDGIRFFGAYGPKVMAQIPYVINTLTNDPSSRQAVVNIWRESPPPTNDVPCTTNVQWLIRDGKLMCIDNMRSSDAWLGWPYDIFNFSVISAYVALTLRGRGIGVELGTLQLNAGSSHLYQKNWAGADQCIFYQARSRQPELKLSDWEGGLHFLDYLTFSYRNRGWLSSLFFPEEVGAHAS